MYYVAINIGNIVIIKKFLRTLGGGPKRKCIEESTK
jgi:hypothetical protein